MKFLIYSASCLAVACANAASVSVLNTNDAEDAAHALFTEQGALLSSAISNNVRLGTFADGFNVGNAWSSGNVNAIESNFIQFSQSTSLFENMDGLLQALFDSTDAAFTGKPIVLWISNSTDFLNPLGQHLIFQFDANFIDTAPTTNQVLDLKPTAGDLLVGEYGNYSHDYGFGGGALDGFNLTTVVPEPSTYALLIGSAIAAIAVARRRKA